MDLSLTKYHISFIITELGSIPQFPGSAIEGCFGRAVEDINPKLYKQLNEINILEKNKAYRYTGDTPPRPYMIFPTVEGGKKRPGDRLSFELTLFGKFSSKINSLIRIFKQMGAIGFGSKFIKAEFVGIENILSPVTLWTEFNFNDYTAFHYNKQELNIKFISPVSFNSQHKMDYDYSFNEFYKRLYLRSFILNHLYGDKSMDDIEHFDFEIELVGNHYLKVDNIYHKGGEKEAYRLGGASLVLKYKAAPVILNELYPLLKFGELIHVGANTVYGFGKYVIELC
jgi:CRISPR-associated endoribonuclease Cas6